jgi:hypothetical protein
MYFNFFFLVSEGLGLVLFLIALKLMAVYFPCVCVCVCVFFVLSASSSYMLETLNLSFTSKFLLPIFNFFVSDPLPVHPQGR